MSFIIGCTYQLIFKYTSILSGFKIVYICDITFKSQFVFSFAVVQARKMKI